MLHSQVVTGWPELLGKSSQFSIRLLINSIFRANNVQHDITKFGMFYFFLIISLPVLLKFDMSSWSTSYSRF